MIGFTIAVICSLYLSKILPKCNPGIKSNTPKIDIISDSLPVVIAKIINITILVHIIAIPKIQKPNIA